MSSAEASREALEHSLAPHGLRVLGGLVPRASDALPTLPHGAPVAVIWLVGQVGSECWDAFAASPFYLDGQRDPLDRWSHSIGKRMAQLYGGTSIYPSDGPPFHPFQQWAKCAEPVQASPLMLQIHPVHGLWSAYRFALLLADLTLQDAQALAAVAALPDPDLCLHCDGQPCLSACPVDAFTDSAFKVDRCAEFLHGLQGAACMNNGCQARRACPVGAAHRYRPEHAAFHMESFASRR